MEVWKVGGYVRLSREDGDKLESDSIGNQRALLEQYLRAHPELQLVEIYQDDGYTGTNFDRPAFRHMEEDLVKGRINCVLVKDLSRFGRDYIETGRYLEREFPARGIRFIAINDHVDSARGSYDMLLPMKNIFNTQYAKDISEKVRSAIKTKQRQGDFIGAFPSYGYRKDPSNHNRLLVDPPAAQVVKRIFDLFEGGMGKIRIAKTLNEEGVASPSEYKRMMGENYNNGRRLENTTYWTYATIHRILQNRMYIGSMEQGRNYRQLMHGKAKQLDRNDWTVVPDTHEAIIGPEQWERVQTLLKARGRDLDFEQNQSPFAGFLFCGDCGRAMTKSTRAGGIYYSCGSYKRYGPAVCSKHSISHKVLEQIVLEDLNRIIAQVQDWKALAEASGSPRKEARTEENGLNIRLERLYRLKKTAYEDYKDGLLNREDYIRYKEDYEHQEQEITNQLQQINSRKEKELLCHPWVESLLRCGKLTQLDRVTVAEAISQIKIYEEGQIEITYKFSGELEALLTQ